MRGSAHRGDPQWRVVWLAVGLIVATALLALIVTAVFPSAARAAPSARITGRVQLCGGPVPGRCYPGSPTVKMVLADNGSKHRVAMAPLDKSRFRMRIATPGIYTLEAVGGRNDHTVWSRTTVRVGVRRTTDVLLTVSIP